MSSTATQKMVRFNEYCAMLGGVVLLFVTISITADVAMRYLFNSPSIWITEVSSYLLLYIIFLGVSYALDQGLHIRVNFAVNMLGESGKKAVNFLTSLFCLCFTGVLLWESSIMTWSAFVGKWTTPTILSTPFVYVYVVMVFGNICLFLSFIFRTVMILAGTYNFKD